ncbi:MAG: Holliday junction resolvase RuvX [Acidimicrobiales bacterium]
MARLLGIDPGARRCGVAVTDSDETMAFPRPALVNNDQLIVALRTLVEEENVALVVTGRPVALSGRKTASTHDADALFTSLVDGLAPVPVVQWDERLTTHEAQRSLSQAGVKAREQRQFVDSAAAVVMLQSYLDAQRED